MTLLRQPGGRKNGGPKKSRGTSCRFCPTGSDFPVGPELWQEVPPSVVGQKSNPYRDVPRKIYIFATPTARTVPEILVARMTLLRQPGGGNGGPKFSRLPTLRPLGSDLSVGPELWQEVPPSAVGFPSGRHFVHSSRSCRSVREFWPEVWPADRLGGIGPTSESAHRLVEENFGARCPVAIRDFFAAPHPIDQNRRATVRRNGARRSGESASVQVGNLLYLRVFMSRSRGGAVWRLMAPKSASK
jgi:hypothetical protein